jgi:hypothetical protein
VLRSAGRAVVARGERAAWVDGGGTVTADFWDVARDPVLLRPAGEREALACAEELLRSGGFALVVLAGVARGAGREAVRLSRAAKEGGGAFVALTEESAVAHLRVVQRVTAGGYAWRWNPFGEPVEVDSAEVVVEATSMGWSGRTTFRLPVRTWGARLALDPLLVDRRGAKRASRARRQEPTVPAPLRRTVAAPLRTAPVLATGGGGPPEKAAVAQERAAVAQERAAVERTEGAA